MTFETPVGTKRLKNEIILELSANSDVPYFATLAEGIANLEPGTYFKTDSSDGVGPHPNKLWYYKRILGAPFHQEMLSAAIPANQKDLEAMAFQFDDLLEEVDGKIQQRPTEAKLGQEGATILGFAYPEFVAKIRKWWQLRYRDIELSGIPGADPNGENDSYNALVLGIALATARRGRLLIDGCYRIQMTDPQGNNRPQIVLTQPLTIAGGVHRRSNITNGKLHCATLFFDKNQPGIAIQDTQLTLERCAIIGSISGVGVSDWYGLEARGENSSLRIGSGVVIQGWNVGIFFGHGYYHVIEDATLVGNHTGFRAGSPTAHNKPPIYNLEIGKIKITASGAAGSICAGIFGGSQVSIAQGSFESYTGDGIVIENSSLQLSGFYFEGHGGSCINALSRSMLDVSGGRVYLNTGSANFIAANEDGVHISSHNNHFMVPEDASVCEVYRLRNADQTAFTNISGDKYLSIPGANVRYIGAGFSGGQGPRTLTGSHQIMYPTGHARQYLPVRTVPFLMEPAIRGLAVPMSGLVMPFACNGNGTAGQITSDDPGAWRINGWGANPMLMVFHKSTDKPDGQWEKIGLRLNYVASPTGTLTTPLTGGAVTGGTTTDAEARTAIQELRAALAEERVLTGQLKTALVGLLTALNKNGVMPQS